MNSTTIVIHNYNIFSLKVTRIILVILGLALAGITLQVFLTEGKVVTPTNFFWGIFLIITSVFALSEKSPFSPKVRITNEYILLKNGFWSGSKKLNWETIQKIEFGSFKTTFHLLGDNYVFKYESDSEVSIQIKKALRIAAQERSVPVIGG